MRQTNRLAIGPLTQQILIVWHVLENFEDADEGEASR
jgi:hypothetical protein